MKRLPATKARGELRAVRPPKYTAIIRLNQNYKVYPAIGGTTGFEFNRHDFINCQRPNTYLTIGKRFGVRAQSNNMKGNSRLALTHILACNKPIKKTSLVFL
jgi:hypothetical protein